MNTVANTAPMGCGLIRARFVEMLNKHELAIARYLLKTGATNKEIARHIDRTEATVKMHMKAINAKLGATNRTQLALILSGLIDETEAGRANREAMAKGKAA